MLGFADLLIFGVKHLLFTTLLFASGRFLVLGIKIDSWILLELRADGLMAKKTTLVGFALL